MLRIGVDVGGTFTDVSVFNEGEIYRGKADTTHYDLKVGLMNAASMALGEAGLDLEPALAAADSIVYSTTVGTNALIERRGTRLGLITTRGFEHTVIVGRSRNWADGLAVEKKYDRGRAVRPELIVPRNRIVGIQERIDNLGRVVIPMKDEEVLDQIQRLVDEGVRGFVVVLLNSFVNATHEQRVRALIRSRYPECYLGHMPVYLSSEISPKSGEYRRSMTVILDAYLREISAEHLMRLTDELRDLGYTRPFFVAKNTGGVASLSRARALELLGSSPAASVVGAEYLSRQIGISNVVMADMGGTSFDVGLVVEGRDRVYEFDPVIDRFRVQIPYIAHWSIGAGGGSVARVAERQLAVGPHSVGSNPGPACYGRGGEEPSVTDADVVLGYLNPENFLGGRLPIDPKRAERAIHRYIAEPLGIPVIEAAWRIKRLVDGTMGQEIYRICAEMSGEDPRQFTAFALGGAGPVHAAGFADFADIATIVSFPVSRGFGAFSTLTFDILQSYEQTVYMTLLMPGGHRYVEQAVDQFNEAAVGLLAMAERDMAEEGFDLSQIELAFELHMSYGQQRQTVPVKLSTGKLEDVEDIRKLCEAFNTAYGERYGRGAMYPEAGIEAVLITLNAVGPVGKFAMGTPAGEIARDDSPAGTRNAYWGPDHGFCDTPVYLCDGVAADVEFAGPALVEAADTVIVVPPEWRFSLDAKRVGRLRAR